MHSAPIILNEAQLATVMAALRYYQAEGLGDERIEDVATASGKFQALDTHKIDALCELINRAPISLHSDSVLVRTEAFIADCKKGDSRRF